MTQINIFHNTLVGMEDMGIAIDTKHLTAKDDTSTPVVDESEIPNVITNNIIIGAPDRFSIRASKCDDITDYIYVDYNAEPTGGFYNNTEECKTKAFIGHIEGALNYEPTNDM